MNGCQSTYHYFMPSHQKPEIRFCGEGYLRILGVPALGNTDVTKQIFDRHLNTYSKVDLLGILTAVLWSYDDLKWYHNTVHENTHTHVKERNYW